MSDPAHTPLPDPLIDEVRAIRRAIMEECDNDLDKLVEQLREMERQHPERVVTPEQSRSRRNEES